MDHHNIIYRSDIINLINDAREANASKSDFERTLLDLVYSKLEDILRKVPDADISCPHCGKPLSE